MNRRFDKRTATISLSVVLALVLGVAAASNVPKATQLPQGDAPAAENDEPTQALPSADAATAVPDGDGITVDQNGEYVTFVDDLPEQVAAEEQQPLPAEDLPEAFVMPEDAAYEPEVALIQLDPSASLEEVNAGLASVEGLLTTQASAEAIESGTMRVELAEGVSVESAVNALLSSGVVEDAQPNYIYTIDEMLEGELDSDEGTEGDDADATDTAEEPQAAETAPRDDVDPAGTEETAAANEATEGAAADEASSTADTEPAATSETTDQPTAEAAAKDEEGADTVEADAEGVSVNDPLVQSKWALQSIHAYEAWEKQKGENYDSTNANHKVTVAIMDVGFNINHADLAANIVKNGSESVWYDASPNGIATTNSSSAPRIVPLYGTTDSTRHHGTHVAGIISAVSNNGVGVSGASYNAGILPIMMFYKDDNSVVTTSESFQRAFDYIVKNKVTYNIRVVNISLGSDSPIGHDNIVSQGIKECYDNNILVVTSAGNMEGHSSAYAHYPSDDTNCMAVMCLAPSGSSVTRSSLSNYNRSASDHKDICAPGVGIESTFYNADATFGTYNDGNNNSYGTMSGTSMATPYVSSVAALMFAANPKLTARQAMNILHGTATDLGAKGWDIYYGFGEVNALAAVQAAKNGGSLTPAQQTLLNSQATAQAQEKKQQQEAAERARQQQLQKQRNAAAANSVKYRTHVQTYGWQGWVAAGAQSGTTGQAKRLEGINIKLEGAPYSGGIQYRTHVQTYGWQGWVANGAQSGTTGQAKRLEAIQIQLTGAMATYYDVWYRVHAQTYGWLGWTANGGRAGTATLAKRLEAIQIVIRPKGSGAPGSTSSSYVTRAVRYRTHVQTYGWQGWAYDGAQAGTTGLAKRLEGINISLPDPLYGGGVRYRTHVQTYGWEAGWRYDGAMSGTSGQAKRLEAIQIQLYGEMASRYDVWYRVHAQTFGWMGWAKNGASAGTAGYAKRLEAIQIVLRPKGSGAPGPTANAFRQR